MSQKWRIYGNSDSIAYYSPEEYAKLLVTADDASELEDTWEEWYQNMQNTRNNLAALGIVCSEVPIHIEALQMYCQEHNLQNNGAARSEYVVSTAARFVEQTWTPAVLAALIQSSFPAFLPKRRKLSDQVMSWRAFGLELAPPLDQR